MNNSELFRKMCVFAEDLQQIKARIGWFDQLDLVFNMNSGISLLGIQLQNNKCGEKLYWIPSTSQIFMLIQQQQNNLSLVVEDFNYWYNLHKDFYSRIPNNNLDILYLMYYMERYNRKFWCFGCGIWKDISQKEDYIKSETDKSAIIS